MKVFISWSGPRSKHIAEALSEWLPLVFETVKPWISSNDIEVGQRWSSEIAGQLEKTEFGIVCVTPENLTAPWILFEAGALAKSVDTGRVVPLLWEVRPSDLSNAGPLSQFQAKPVDKDGICDIVLGLNKLLKDPRSEDTLKQLVDAVWPNFNVRLNNMPPADNPVRQEHRPTGEVLEELVSMVRSLDHAVRDLSRENEEHFFPGTFGGRNTTRSTKTPEFLTRAIADLLESDRSSRIGFKPPQSPAVQETSEAPERVVKPANDKDETE